MTETVRKRFAVVGSPVTHSKSPAMHRAAFGALGLPHEYERIDTKDSELVDRVQALRDGTFSGLNVTVPHKRRVLELVDDVDASAAATGAANTLVRTAEGRIVAHNTDAPALRDELVDLGDDPRAFRGRSAMVIGTGGTARAAVYALGLLGVERIVVRSRARSDDLAHPLAASGSRAQLSFEPLEAPPSERQDLIAIVQATSAGMTGGAPGEIAANAVGWFTLPVDCLAYDVVYAPSETVFLEHAQSAELRCRGGLGMLARQGALALELWLPVVAPLDVMRIAVGLTPDFAPESRGPESLIP